MLAFDLDNTILCYADAFRAAAVRLGCLPASGSPFNKSTVKAAACALGGNELWTRLQGLAYGDEIRHATLFPGCAEFVQASGEEMVIVSHKTPFPALGPRTDLRAAATARLASLGLAGLPVQFFDTREAKVAALVTLRPRAILDDLPEVFTTPGFPPATLFVLFDPTNAHSDWTRSPRVATWNAARQMLL